MLGENGKQLAHQIYKASNDIMLRKRIGIQGRKTYELKYQPKVAFKNIFS